MNKVTPKQQLQDELTKLRQRVADFEAQESKRKRVEEELKQNKEYLESLNDSLSEAIITVDIPDNIDDRIIRYVNKSVEKIFGYEQKELLGKSPVVQYASKEDFINLGKVLKSAISRGTKLIRRELLFKRKNGETFPAELTTTFLRTGGKVRQIISIVRDITERKRADEALHLRANLLNETTDSIIATDLDGNLIYMNEATCRTYGYSKEQLLNMNLRQLVSPDIARLADERLRRVKEEGAITFESEHRRRDGSVFPVEVTARTVNLGDGTIILSVIRDITERKQAEEALEISEDKFSRAFHSNPHPMSIVTMEEGRYLDVNDSYVRTFGFSREELLGRTTLEMGIAKTRRFRIRLLQILEKKQEVKNLEVEFYTRSGHKVNALLSADKMEIGGETCLLSVINDVTERKKAEAEVEAGRQRLEEIMENIIDGVGVSDAQGTVTQINKAFANMYGYDTADEIIGKKFFDLLAEEELPRVTEKFQEMFKNKVNTLKDLEVNCSRKDGSKFPALINIANLWDDRGNLESFVVVRDITERKKMEEQLIVTDRLASIGELASGVAHELNNPLTGIIGFSDLLLNKDVPEDVREDLKVINREAKRTAQVVRNLLTFARKHDTTKKPADINKAIKSVLDLRAYDQKVHNIEAVTNFDPELPEITADIFRLQQVFVNITINAEYFIVQAHGRGTITITTKVKGNTILASFADDGPGIKKEHLRHLFDPFFTTKEVGQGTGLGLSICHGIVTEHGGRIYAESKPGQGATFIVELPVR